MLHGPLNVKCPHIYLKLRIFPVRCILNKRTPSIKFIYLLNIVAAHLLLSSINSAFHCDTLQHIGTSPLSSVSITVNSLLKPFHYQLMHIMLKNTELLKHSKITLQHVSVYAETIFRELQSVLG